MINKIVQSIADAMAGIQDGSTVLIAGFGAIGQPNALIEGLIEQGARDLVAVANNAGVGHEGLARLMELGRVRKIICVHRRQIGKSAIGGGCRPIEPVCRRSEDRVLPSLVNVAPRLGPSP